MSCLSSVACVLVRSRSLFCVCNAEPNLLRIGKTRRRSVCTYTVHTVYGGYTQKEKKFARVCVCVCAIFVSLFSPNRIHLCSIPFYFSLTLGPRGHVVLIKAYILVHVKTLAFNLMGKHLEYCYSLTLVVSLLV